MAEAQLNRGFCHLVMQDFANGLPLLEWRKRMPEPMEARIYPQPLWDGSQDINGKTLFAYIEQGLGDTIQYYRCIGLAQARGARLVRVEAEQDPVVAPSYAYARKGYQHLRGLVDALAETNR